MLLHRMVNVIVFMQFKIILNISHNLFEYNLENILFIFSYQISNLCCFFP